MSHLELIDYCQTNGVEHNLIPRGGFEVLRVMDLSQLPGSMRDYFDCDTGVYNKPLVAEIEKSPDEIPEPIPEPESQEDAVLEPQESGAEPFAEEEPPKKKRGSK